jgi:hypothetical protein
MPGIAVPGIPWTLVVHMLGSEYTKIPGRSPAYLGFRFKRVPSNLGSSVDLRVYPGMLGYTGPGLNWVPKHPWIPGRFPGAPGHAGAFEIIVTRGFMNS